MYYDLELNKWEIFHKHELSRNDSIQSVQVYMKDFILSIGGQLWDQFAIKSVRLITNTSFTVLDSEIDLYIYAFIFYWN